MKRVLRYFLLLPAVLGLGILLALGLIGGTSQGLQLTARLLPVISNGAVTVASTEGRLFGSWQLQGIRVAVPGTAITIAELGCSWQPAALWQGELHVGHLDVVGLEVMLEADSEQTAAAVGPAGLPTGPLPLAVLIGRLTIDGVRVLEAGEPEPLVELERLTLILEGRGERLQLQEFEVTAPTAALQGDGFLELTRNWPLSLNLNGWYRADKLPTVSGEAVVSGFAASPHLELTIHRPAAARVSISATELLSGPHWQGNASIAEVLLSELDPELPPASLTGRLEFSGTGPDYRARLHGAFRTASWPAMTFNADLSGGPKRLEVLTGNAVIQSGSVDFNGDMEWDRQLSWNLSAAVEGIEPSLFAALPGGTVEGRVTASGSFEPDGPVYQLKATELQVHPLIGNSLTDGSLQLEGDSEELRILAAELGVGGGRAEFAGALSWTRGFTWNGLFTLAAIDPSKLSSLPRGSLGGSVAISGRGTGSDLEATIELFGVEGDLAGYQLEGGGRLAFAGGVLAGIEAGLTNGGNSLTVNGSVDERFDLDFSFTGAELARLVPELNGSLSCSGRISGARDNPVVDLDWSGADLEYQRYRAARFLGSASFGLNPGAAVDAELTFGGIEAPELAAESLVLELTGSTAEPRARIRLESPFGVMAFQFAGQLVEPFTWRGRLGRFAWSAGPWGDWSQLGEAGLEFGLERAELEGFCLDGEPGDICLSGGWARPDSWSLELSKLEVSLGKLRTAELLNEPLSGTVTARGAAAGAGSGLELLEARISTDSLLYETTETAAVEGLPPVSASVEAVLGQAGLEVVWQAASNDGDLLSGRVLVADFGDLSAPLAPLPLSGRLRGDIRHLEPLIALAGNYLVPTGRITTDLELGGTLGSPRLRGDFDLDSGKLIMPRLGVEITDLSGSMKAQGDTLTLRLEGISGPGRITAAGNFSIDAAGWTGEISVGGERVQLYNQRELSVLANPALQLQLGPAGGVLTGRVMIPEARIEPEGMTGADTESPDVIVMSGGDTRRDWPLDADLVVELGSGVRLDGYGLNGALGGRLQVFTRENQGLCASGELFLRDGVFSIYGRSLEIVRGRLIFDGGPIDSPGLDISARKEVETDDPRQQKIVVGINVSGVIYDYDVELFSIPPLSEEQIFAYLVLGKSSAAGDQELSVLEMAAQSVGLGGDDGLLGQVGELLPVDAIRFEGTGATEDSALVVSKQLTRDLSVGYDFNLYKNIGYFRVRYEIGAGFAAESRTSSISSSIDLLYSFER